jgi:RimJ/RimL family protein N-acetyltransferase
MLEGRDQFALQGPTMTARLPRAGEAKTLESLVSHLDLRWFASDFYDETADGRADLDLLSDLRETGRQLVLLQEHRQMGPVGITALSEFSYANRRATVGTWLAPNARETGADAECHALVAHVAFALLGLVRLGSYATVDDEALRGSLRDAGFVEEAILRNWWRRDGRFFDVVSYSLLAVNWRAGHAVVPITVAGAIPSAFPTRLATADG